MSDETPGLHILACTTELAYVHMHAAHIYTHTSPKKTMTEKPATEEI